MRLTTLAELGFVVLAGTAVYGFVSLARSSEARRACLPVCALRPTYAGHNRTAPDFELTGLDGRRVRLSSFRGRAVVLNFWMSTCAPCIEELPSLAALARVAAKRSDVVVLSVSTDPDEATARGGIQSGLGGPAPFPVLLDPESSVVAAKYGTHLFPETWLIDKDGVIRARFDGARDWSSSLMLELIASYAGRQACAVEVSAGAPDALSEQVCEQALSLR